jgi:hypothetical protein
MTFPSLSVCAISIKKGIRDHDLVETINIYFFPIHFSPIKWQLKGRKILLQREQNETTVVISNWRAEADVGIFLKKIMRKLPTKL